MSENDNPIVAKIIEPLKSKTSGVLSWIYSTEGSIITKAIAALSSYVVGDPTGMVFPTILECADYGIRKRVLKHFPDVVDKLNKEQMNLNKVFIQSELGQQLLRDTFQVFVKEINEEKIEAQKSFLINAYKQQNPDDVILNSCMKALLNLEPIQLQILRVIYQPREAVEYIFNKNKHNRGDTTYVEILHELNLYIKTDDEIYKNSINKLNAEGLLNVNTGSNGPKGGYPESNIQEGIGTMSNATQKMVTPLGKKFIRLIAKI